ncbi:YheC/YheD family protein [Neobacillus pocheonensis]|uniref:YheC/YheD family protein n=1 Tax=Neobacillus pocheonensis TaxID=363869 RepID=A0ABT0W8V0_9BACI|nr:YheC/YheD family protein [Neobacillus pocheonensis]
MKQKYKIIPDLNAQNSLTIHPNEAKQNNILSFKKWFLRFGIQALEIKLKTSSSLNENEIKLSVGIIDFLRIPLCCRFEIRQENNEILLGPFIGILATLKKKSLDESVQYLSNYLYDYEHIGGAVIAFSLEGIDPHRYTIEGYIFNPDRKEWEPGVYSYPASVFKIIYLNKDWRNHFQTVFGSRLFNSYVFNKWEMYKWLSKEANIIPYLPKTVLYSKPQDLESFLNIYNDIFVKPVHGSMGDRIFKVSKIGKKELNLEYHQNGVPYETIFPNVFDLAAFFKAQFKGKTIILQQALDLISFEGKKIDFRIVMVKNQVGVWEDMCMVAKYGQQGSIVTNILAGGTAKIGEITLQKIFSVSDEEVFRLRKEISRIIHDAAQWIEQCGVHCGNLGIDIAIDTLRKIWIIEMNNLNPSPLFALDISDRQLFYQIKRLNMLYAKRLAGFPEEL